MQIPCETAGQPHKESAMWEIYKDCLRKAFPGAWNATWIIPTLLSIGGFASASFGKPFEAATMNLLLGIVPLAIFAGVMIAGPLLIALRDLKELRSHVEQQAQRPVSLSAHQLWNQFMSDPLGSQQRLRLVRVSGHVVYNRQDNGSGPWEVGLNGEEPREPKILRGEEAMREIQLAPLRVPKIVACLFDQKVEVTGQVTIEGNFSEYNPQAQGGTISLTTCRLVT